MRDWPDLVLAYAGYLALLAWMVPRFARARAPALAMAAGGAAAWAGWPMLPDEGAGALIAKVVVPSLMLLAAYRVSGVFFIAPNAAVERWLLDIDGAALGRTGLLDAYSGSPVLVREVVELFYLLVYAIVPLGATALVLGGRPGALDRYWAVVFAAELACYAVLPWVQTRPPRAIEDDPGAASARPRLRRLNLVVLGVGSIQVNTFPSAHAAGAVAIALAVASALPAAGPAFAVLAIGIVLATVLGRYHYLADSVIGVLVSIAAWRLLGV